MAKGIPVTEKNVRAAFKEAGFKKVTITITYGSRSGKERINYQLPDGTRGVMEPHHGLLPEERSHRISKIRGDVNRNRRILGL
jgi:hypothetical protein